MDLPVSDAFRRGRPDYSFYARAWPEFAKQDTSNIFGAYTEAASGLYGPYQQ